MGTSSNLSKTIRGMGAPIPPVNACDALLHDTLDHLEHAGVFLIDPVGQVSPIIQDLRNAENPSMTGLNRIIAV